jgi:signal peptidase I
MGTSAVTASPPRRIWKPLLAATALVVAAVAVGGLLYLRTWPPLATVMSASMTPTIKTGDVVLLGRLDRPARVGDIVEVSVPDDARNRYGYPPVVIHRIVAITPGGQVQTKGDARQQKDPFTVSRKSLSARVVATIPAAGRIFAFLVSPLGLIWLIGGGVLLFGMPLFENRRDHHQREQQTLEEMRRELQAMSAELRALTAAPREEVVEPEPSGPHLLEDLLVEHVPEWDPDAKMVERPAVHAEAGRLDDVPDEWVVTVPVEEDPILVRRRSGGLVGSVERYARSLSSRYR